MLFNYLLVLYRNFTRQLTYSFINVLGLAVGLACSLIIFLYVYGELGYDKGFANGDRVYRIGVSFFNIGKFAMAPEKLLTTLPAEFEGIETATRISNARAVSIRVHEQELTEPDVFYTDSAYFHVFDYAFVAGNGKTVLRNPNEAVITEEVAKKYFGNNDALNQIIEVGKNKTPFKITGIVQAPGFNTHLRTSVWLSIQGELAGEQHWTSAAFHSYVLLKKNVTEQELKKAVDKLIEKHVFPESGIPMGISTLDAFLKNENAVRFYIHPLHDIYLKSKLFNEIIPGGNENNLAIFSGIAVFVLLLASVNFINLTTARASRRAKEVGIRKTMGTSRRKLIFQFLVESVSITTLAMVFAIVLGELFLAFFKSFTGFALISSILQSPKDLILYFMFSFVVGILSGIYPAFYLTGFTPAKVLKGSVAISDGVAFRNSLVIFQFSISIVLIVCTMIVARQFKFMQTTDLGFDQQNVVTIDQTRLLGEAGESFKDELLRGNGVVRASFHAGEPGSTRVATFQTYITPVVKDAVTINTYFGDAEYCQLMGFRLKEGRFFSKELASDSSGVILNEEAVKLLRMGDHPIGSVVNKDKRVIGVVNNFHWQSLRNSIGPAAIMLSPWKIELGFKVEANAMPDFLKKAEQLWKQRVPGEPFHYHFLDSNFGDILEKEKVFGEAIFFFTGLAIFISCLGLYGLAAFTAEQRTREIGIRKVLGASSSAIVWMLNRNFTRLIAISAVIAVPVSAWCASKWLEGFSYKISPGIWTFVVAGGAALVVALVTVSYHSLKASSADPAKSLKYE